MKIILSIVFSFCLVILAHAQSPNQLQYQAIIRNASGAVVSNQAVGMRVSLLKSSASGTVVYAETHRDTTTTNGLVTVEIGAGTVVSGSFASVNWGQGPYFIKTETDITGGTNYQLISTTQLLSVPYALYANDIPVSKSGDTIRIGSSRLIIPGTTLIANAAPATLSDGLLAYYPFNGNANDESGNNRNGVTKNVTSVPDRFSKSNSAFRFNGISNTSGSIIKVPDTILNIGSTAYSIHIWFKLSNLTQVTRSIINTIPHTGIEIGYNNNNAPGYISYFIGPATTFWNILHKYGSKKDYQADKWYSLTFIKNGTNYKFYVNGILDDSFVNSNASAYNKKVGFYFGGVDELGNQYFTGDIDDIRIYDRVLTDEEISYLSSN